MTTDRKLLGSRGRNAPPDDSDDEIALTPQADDRRERLAALGHQPTDDGRCLHRWRNRTTVAVRCRFLEGWLAANPAAPALDVERLARAIYNFDRIGAPKLTFGADYGPVAEGIAREYAALDNAAREAR